MKKDKNNQKIECNIDSCIHNDNDCQMCDLDQIKVVSNKKDCNCKEETICDDFENEEESSE